MKTELTQFLRQDVLARSRVQLFVAAKCFVGELRTTLAVTRRKERGCGLRASFGDVEGSAAGVRGLEGPSVEASAFT